MRTTLAILCCLLLMLSSCEHRERTDQGRSQACWIYAMLACIEHEQLRKGDSVALSRQWLVARCLEEQAQEALLERQQGNEDYAISMRGVGPEALRLIRKYGLVPYAMEKGEVNNSNVMERKLMLAVETSASLSELNGKTEDLLPDFTLGRPADRNAQPTFYFFSMCYTPLQFAESIMYDQNWTWYTSVPYHADHERFALAIPDNRRYHEYENLPMNELVDKVTASLKAGHAVYWEYGKPLPEGGCSSNHAMAIVGLSTGKDGRTLLHCLNSYGKRWGNNGYCDISIDDFKKRTCNVGVME